MRRVAFADDDGAAAGSSDFCRVRRRLLAAAGLFVTASERPADGVSAGERRFRFLSVVGVVGLLRFWGGGEPTVEDSFGNRSLRLPGGTTAGLWPLPFLAEGDAELAVPAADLLKPLPPPTQIDMSSSQECGCCCLFFVFCFPPPAPTPAVVEIAVAANGVSSPSSSMIDGHRMTIRGRSPTARRAEVPARGNRGRGGRFFCWAPSGLTRPRLVNFEEQYLYSQQCPFSVFFSRRPLRYPLTSATLLVVEVVGCYRRGQYSRVVKVPSWRGGVVQKVEPHLKIITNDRCLPGVRIDGFQIPPPFSIEDELGVLRTYYLVALLHLL